MLPIIVRAGGRPVWRAEPRSVLIGPADETWDEVILVRYPNVAAFASVLGDPEYGVSEPLRTAALVDARVMVAIAPQRISAAVWAVATLGLQLRRLGETATKSAHQANRSISSVLGTFSRGGPRRHLPPGTRH
jgi:hypothetical protein